MYVTIPIITVVVFVIVESLRKIFKNKKFDNFVPLISCFLGGGIALIAYFTAPKVINVENGFLAVVMGLFSGLVSTGSTDMVKKMMDISKDKKEIKEDKDVNVLNKIEDVEEDKELIENKQKSKKIED